jgi:hypothetical protein
MFQVFLVKVGNEISGGGEGWGGFGRGGESCMVGVSWIPFGIRGRGGARGGIRFEDMVVWRWQRGEVL